MHDGTDVIRKVQSVAVFHLEVPLFAFKTGHIYIHTRTCMQYTHTHTQEQSLSQFTSDDVVPVNGDVAFAVLASVLVMHPQCVDDLVADVAHFARV